MPLLFHCGIHLLFSVGEGPSPRVGATLAVAREVCV